MRSRVKVVRTCFALGLVTGCAGDIDAPSGTLVVNVDRDSPPVPAPGANVAITFAPGSATTDAAGTATFSPVIATTFNVVVTLDGYCPSAHSVTISDGVTETLNVSMGTSPCATPTDNVTTDAALPFYAIVDIRTGVPASPASCENDEVRDGTSGVADLLTNALRLFDGVFKCHGAAWVFTPDRAPWFDSTSLTFPWTNNSGDLLTVTLPPNRLRIPVTFWLTDFPEKSAYRSALLESLMPDANYFLYQHHTGLILTNSETADDLPDIVDVGSLPDGDTGAAPHPVIGKGCSSTSSITRTPEVYRPEHLNVYVVEEIEDGPAGINCVTHGSANIVFVDFKRGYQILLHEIGHGLALVRPQWGHSDGLIGLYPLNLMDSAIDDTQEVLYMGLGQIAWMHGDATSWLNQQNGVGTVRSRQFPGAFVTSCPCPGDAPTVDCPALQTDISRMGMPNAGVSERACFLEASQSCLSLEAGTSGAISVEGWTDDKKSTPGSGIASYASLDPSVAKVSFDASDGSTLTVTVTGVNSGSTDILLSLGGVFTRVPVKVGSSCP